MNRAQYIRSLCEYEGPSRFRHKVMGAALGVGGLGAAALLGHAMAKGQSPLTSLHDLGHSISTHYTNFTHQGSGSGGATPASPSSSSATTPPTDPTVTKTSTSYQGPGVEHVKTYNGQPVKPENAPAILQHAKEMQQRMNQSTQQSPTPGTSFSGYGVSTTKGPGQVMQSTRGLAPTISVR